jgi:hypothetical protein
MIRPRASQSIFKSPQGFAVSNLTTKRAFE